MTDPIADMLTRIRNASAVRKESVSMPFSRLKAAIADVLKKEGYIADLSVIKDAGVEQLVMNLKYHNTIPAIHTLKRVSSPGCRIYAQSDSLPVVMNNVGIAILSTSKGVMTNREAKKMRLGGEVLCEIS
ncbi:30S ribosomal protein S8 [Candidatus Uhrbacteria bacterium]|nr:30S ribosomal protein S8 [Candidatus Uhrbacteria bacterium]